MLRDSISNHMLVHLVLDIYTVTALAEDVGGVGTRIHFRYSVRLCSSRFSRIRRHFYRHYKRVGTGGIRHRAGTLRVYHARAYTPVQ